VVLFVGSEFRRKGLADLIRAMGPDITLLVVGQGERLGYYQKLAQKHGVSERVFFKGLTDNVRHFYAAADVVALPSLREAFGMSILEAMACGLPVVSSAATGVAGIIEDGKNGYIFKDSRQIGSILQLLKAADLRRSIGRRARLTAEKHTWEATASIYEDLCLKIAREKKISPAALFYRRWSKRDLYFASTPLICYKPYTASIHSVGVLKGLPNRSGEK